MTKSKAVHLLSHPKGMPEIENFEIVETTVPDLVDGEVLIRTIYLSVDPYMRGRMNAADPTASKHYADAFEIGRPMMGGLVGEVIESRDESCPVGETVLFHGPWCEYVVSSAKAIRKITTSPRVSLSAFLGILGMPGQTAYAGLRCIGKIREGQTVYVSAAAGAVGSAACQIAKNLGCTVIGSAGSDEKVEWLLDRARVDHAFNYRTVDSLARELSEHGEIDIYFDNVGGSTLEAALPNMALGGRVALCGMISGYNRMTKGVRNLFLAITRRLTLQGFIVSDLSDEIGDFEQVMTGWIDEGAMTWRETVSQGIESTPQAFIDMLSGNKIGKMVVRVSSETT